MEENKEYYSNYDNFFLFSNERVKTGIYYNQLKESVSHGALCVVIVFVYIIHFCHTVAMARVIH